MLFKPGPVISPLVDSPILPKQAGKVRAEAEAEAALRARQEETTAAVAVAAEASQGAKRATEASEDASQKGDAQLNRPSLPAGRWSTTGSQQRCET